jgi:hypothetical protein
MWVWAVPLLYRVGAKGRNGAFSVERVMDFLRALGQDVEITVRPKRKPHGEVPVIA